MQGVENSEKRVLEVRMLGDLQIMLEDKEIKLPGGIYSKTMRLFLLIAYYGDRGISREDVLELLYGDGEYADDSGSLRVASYRLRKQLTEAGILFEKGSISKKGKFRLSQEGLEVVVDARIFEEAAHKALRTRSEQEQEELLEKACKMYVGEFLPALAAEMWVAGKQASYQNLYFQCLRRYLGILARTGKYGKMLFAARNALRLYPYEEWCVAELDALMGMGRWKEAEEAAQRSTKSLMDRMGVHPSKELEERIRKIDLQLKGSTKNLMEICRELEEVCDDSGAYCCNYQSFVGTYHYEMRRIERTGESLYLVLCSMTEKEETKYPGVEDRDFEIAIEQLGSAIRQALRRADVYTRYGSNQYLMLLVGLKQEDCAIISSRIQNLFGRNPGAGKFALHHFIAPAAPAVRGEGNPEVKFKQNNWGVM